MGSSTSGNFGHAGRKGEVGGSAPGVGDHVMFDLGNGAGREQGHVTEVHPSGQTMHVMNDKTKEIHHIESGQLRGNLRRASGSIWGKDANMRVNPGTKAPGIKAAAGEREVGNHMTEVTTPEGHRILKSYGTPVAMKALGGEPYQTEKKWSTTTTGHIRKWMGDTSNVKTKPQEFFDKAAARVGQDQFGTFRKGSQDTGAGSKHLDFVLHARIAKGMSESELRYAMKDAGEAGRAMPKDQGYYNDQISVYHQELSSRNGTPENVKFKASRAAYRKIKFGSGTSKG